MLIMLVSGSCNTIVMKAQDKVEVAPIKGAVADEGDHGKFYYRHPYFQSANTFAGEFTCLVVWGCKMAFNFYTRKESLRSISEVENRELKNKPKLKTKINPLYLFFPAFFDVSGCTIMFLSLANTAASVYQMMRGIIVVITAILSVLLLGRK